MVNDREFTQLISFLNSFELYQLPDNWQHRIQELFRYINQSNEQHNLTRITTFNEFLYKHIADSLLLRAVFPPIESAQLNIADVGCGGGFPGIPLAVTFTKSKFTEIESNRKKGSLVESLINVLELTNCNVIVGRARELARTAALRETFDLVLARAVKDTAYLIGECRRLLRQPTGVLIAYKTPSGIKKERMLAEREANKRGFQLVESPIYSLPRDCGKRQFCIIKYRDSMGQPGTESFPHKSK